MGEICVKGDKQNVENNNSDLDSNNNVKNNSAGQNVIEKDEHSHLLLNYSSQYDIVFTELENNFNFLNQINLNEFFNLLTNFTCKSHTERLLLEGEKPKVLLLSENKNIFTNVDIRNPNKTLHIKIYEEIDEANFNYFIKSKIINNVNTILYNAKDELECEIFKDFMMSLYRRISNDLNFIHNYTDNNNNTEKDLLKQNPIDEKPAEALSAVNPNNNNGNSQHGFKIKTKITLKKIHIMALAFLYCKSKIKEKIEFIFKLFSVGGEDNQTMEKESSAGLFQFIFLIISLGSYSGIEVINEVSSKYKSLTKIKEKDLIFLSSKFNQNKLYTISEFFIEKVFCTDKIEKSSFLNMMLRGIFNWVLSTKGIRYMVENFSRRQKIY